MQKIWTNVPVFRLALIHVWQLWLSGPLTSKAQLQFLPVISTDTNHQYCTVSLLCTRRDLFPGGCCCQKPTGTAHASKPCTARCKCAKQLDCSARTEYHLSHKLETRHLLKIRRTCSGDPMEKKPPCGGGHVWPCPRLSPVSRLFELV